MAKRNIWTKGNVAKMNVESLIYFRNKSKETIEGFIANNMNLNECAGMKILPLVEAELGKRGITL